MEKTVIDFGDTVLCDICNEDYTNSNESGGCLFDNNAVCPKCINGGFIDSVKQYNEEDHIKSYCSNGMPFKDYVLKIRNGNNNLVIQGFNTTEEMMKALDKE